MSDSADSDIPALVSTSEESESGSDTESTAASADYNDIPCVFCVTLRHCVMLAFGLSYENWLSVNATPTYSFLYDAVMIIHGLFGCGAEALWPIGLILATYKGIK